VIQLNIIKNRRRHFMQERRIDRAPLLLAWTLGLALELSAVIPTPR
jgi:hypothetical protein